MTRFSFGMPNAPLFYFALVISSHIIVLNAEPIASNAEIYMLNDLVLMHVMFQLLVWILCKANSNDKLHFSLFYI